MTKVTFYYDIVSPFAYFAYVTFKRYLTYWNVTEFRLKPVFLGGVMVAAENKPPLTIPNKGIWLKSDQQYTKEYFKFDFEMPEKFPVNTINVMRFLRSLEDYKLDALEPATDRFYAAFFGSNKVDVIKTDKYPQILKGILSEEEVHKLLKDSSTNENKERVKQEAIDLVKKGAFGMPWMVVERDDGKERTFWGSDRWEMIGYFLNKPWKGPFPPSTDSKL